MDGMMGRRDDGATVRRSDDDGTVRYGMDDDGDEGRSRATGGTGRCRDG